MINELSISNYKSIQSLFINCSRINVFIGEPNVGKSNILEALDLSYLSSMLGQNKFNEKSGYEKIDLKKFFRVENAAQLFRFGNILEPIIVKHSSSFTDTSVSFNNKHNPNVFEWNNGINVTKFDKDFQSIQNDSFYNSAIESFRYKESIQFHETGHALSSFQAPFGNNLIEVLQYNPSFREVVGDILEESGLELNLDIVEHKIYLQIRIRKGLVYSVPYTSVADTYRRLIFYLAAIKFSNADVITLEEPDAHSFPKYVSYLGDEMINTINRQFFIATHNPYLLNNLIEKTPVHELSVFICSKEGDGTKVRKLSENDLSELIDYGVDIFFNLNRYSDDSVEHSS